MPRVSIRLPAAALLLLASLLLTPAAFAGERRPVTEPGARASAASSWEFLANLWGGLARFLHAAPADPGSLANVHENNGCSIDPNGGNCKPSSPAPLGNGCTIDPSGGGCWGS